MIRYVTKSDERQIVSMMELVKDDFAGYKEKEFLQAVHNAVRKEEAIMEEEDGRIAGLLMCSKETKELSFLAVHPDYRKKGVAKRLIVKMAEWFTSGDIISVVTFREGDPKGIPARACYHACGFVDDENLIVFDYPCQRLVLRL
ncbi:GNAT family N-acetyltransferase [Lactonifactor longoviformis]|uniref:GNAT family N-acetyltransferase n=1 Tax=Lactonifactor longoviformis TaxID=341220 RepID=UPI001D009264|nr:GNAT family N-acetyltransferase [Lactonifactor longoviformis]MCB5714239.1 GNAT family N-acetyltransferase [Lactonifactor longoviformis]MCB5718194.1 GNAT family N-acetyltransferase [Lactonifactor longoviformis]